MKGQQNLLILLANGNEEAFNKFFYLKKDKIYHLLLASVKLPEIAEELTIDVFLKIWQKREALPEVENIDAFLFTICKRKALDFFKSAARDKKLQALINDQILREAQQPAIESNSLLSLESKELVEMLFKKLSPQRKAILMLSRVEGLSHKEISEELNISQNTVKNTITQTLKLLEPLKRKLWLETCWIVFILSLL